MSTDALIMFMEWRIIATDFDCSSNSGRSAVNEGNMSFSDSRSVWKDDQEIFKLPSNGSSTFSWTCLSQQDSFSISASSVGFCKRSMCVAGMIGSFSLRTAGGTFEYFSGNHLTVCDSHSVSSKADTTWLSPVTWLFLNWKREMPVPWKESFAVVALRLWSILSTAAVV